MYQNNDLKKHLSSQIRPQKTKSDQVEEQQQQTYVKDPEQECSRSKILLEIPFIRCTWGSN